MNKTSIGLLAIFFAITATSNFCMMEPQGSANKKSDSDNAWMDIEREQYENNICRFFTNGISATEGKTATLNGKLQEYTQSNEPYAITQILARLTPRLSTLTFVGLLLKSLPSHPVENPSGVALAFGISAFGAGCIEFACNKLLVSKVEGFKAKKLEFEQKIGQTLEVQTFLQRNVRIAEN